MISIIIPTFNSAKTLAQAIDSILDQTFADWEMILIDGVSKDQTIELIKSYSDQNNKIRWISEPDQGIYDAMNKGLKMAKGNWVYFLGSDDRLYDKNVLTKIFEKSIPKELGIICGRVDRENLGISDIQSTEKEKIIFDNLNHQSIICRRPILEKFPFERQYSVYADQVQLIRMVAAGIKSIQKDIIIAHYSMQGYSSYQVDLEYANDKGAILLLLFKNKLLPKLIYRSLKNQSFEQIKYLNPIVGLIWLYKGGLLGEGWRDILYCFKVRFYRSILGSSRYK